MILAAAWRKGVLICRTPWEEGNLHVLSQYEAPEHHGAMDVRSTLEAVCITDCITDQKAWASPRPQKSSARLHSVEYVSSKRFFALQCDETPIQCEVVIWFCVDSSSWLLMLYQYASMTWTLKRSPRVQEAVRSGVRQVGLSEFRISHSCHAVLYHVICTRIGYLVQPIIPVQGGSVVFAPAYPAVIIYSCGGHVVLFDCHTYTTLQSVAVQQTVCSLATSTDGRFIAAGGTGGAVFLIDTTRGMTVSELSGHMHSVKCMVFSEPSRLTSASGADLFQWTVPVA
jgi:hypothetical protein